MIPRYRAFYKANQKMYEVLTLDIIDEKVLIENNDNPKSPLRGYVKITETELMQSTGLKDKNGVEIFEGDIVENTTQRVYLGHRFEVSWNGGYACFQLLNGGKSSNVPLIQDFMSYEVVGNIYENPELLEVEG